MYATHFRAKHFRCLYDTNWIPIHDLTVLIGENDGGKTATIDALEILLTGKSPDPEDFSFGPESQQKREQEMVLEAKFTLEANDIAVLQDLCRYSSDQLVIRRDFRPDFAGPWKYRTMVHSDERLCVDLAGCKVDTLREIAEEHGIDLRGLRLKGEIVNGIETWLASQPLVEGYRELPRAARELLPQIQVFRSAAALDPQREVETVLRTVFIAEIGSDTYQGSLTEISAQIEATLNEHVARLTPVVQKYRPEIREVRVDPRFDYSRGLATSRLQLIGQDGRPISLEKRGEGIKRQVTLAVYEWNSELLAARPEEGARPLVLAFDEPDSHLDYYSQRKIFEIIRSLVKPGIQIIVCTHSLNLINRVPITNINHYYLDDDYCTRVTALQSDDPTTLEYFVDEIGKNMGLENSLMFHERCFLVVEGPSEMTALPRLSSVWHEDRVSLTSTGIRLLNGENNVGARNFAKFLNDNNRNVVFMLDSDSQKDPKGRIFTQEGLRRAGFDIDRQVFFVGDREFEDSFSDALWARVGNARWPREDERRWQPDDFAALRSQDKKFSDGLCALFRASKPEIAYELAKCVDNPLEIPAQIRRCFEHALRLANP